MLPLVWEPKGYWQKDWLCSRPVSKPIVANSGFHLVRKRVFNNSELCRTPFTCNSSFLPSCHPAILRLPDTRPFTKVRKNEFLGASHCPVARGLWSILDMMSPLFPPCSYMSPWAASQPCSRHHVTMQQARRPRRSCLSGQMGIWKKGKEKSVLV